MTDDDRDDSFLQAVAFVAPVDPGPLERVAIGSVLGDKYLLEEPIGRGGMAHVFAARHQLTGKRVAVKWLRPEFARDEKAARRFVREARAIGSIDHPNVVAVHDAGMHHGSPYLVMELLEGQTLRARMREAPPLELREIIAITLAVIAGVREAHRHGILHRDIKPDNVFLCARPSLPPLPKVLDFGVSSALHETSEFSTLTDHGTIVGTPGYMPLEQLQGTTELDPRADVYAVGVVLYEMLTGQRPFPARTYGELIVQLAVTSAPRPERARPGLDDELSAIVMKAIAREREDRFPDLESMAHALSTYPRHGRLRRVAAAAWRPALVLAIALLLALGRDAVRSDSRAGEPNASERTVHGAAPALRSDASSGPPARAPAPAAAQREPAWVAPPTAVPPALQPSEAMPAAEAAPQSAASALRPPMPRRSQRASRRGATTTSDPPPVAAAVPDRATTLRRADF